MGYDRYRGQQLGTLRSVAEKAEEMLGLWDENIDHAAEMEVRGLRICASLGSVAAAPINC